jgi:hypothetical protein
MDIQAIVSDLKAECNRIDRASPRLKDLLRLQPDVVARQGRQRLVENVAE